jgi:hypothetical protein
MESLTTLEGDIILTASYLVFDDMTKRECGEKIEL